MLVSKQTQWFLQNDTGDTVSWIKKIVNKASSQLERDLDENPIDKVIIEKGADHPEVSKIYQARWVWYHTILAVEIFFTNILLSAILVTLLVILAKI